MSEFVRDRSKLVMAVIIVALLAAVGYLLATRGEERSATSQELAQLETAFAEQEKQAQDSNAKSLLRNAAIAMESLYAERQDFVGALQLIGSIEPNVVWTPGASARADADTVAVTFTPTNLGYVLTTTSSSGTTFTFSRDDEANIVRSCGPACTW